jgi:hypothetical protein
LKDGETVFLLLGYFFHVVEDKRVFLAFVTLLIILAVEFSLGQYYIGNLFVGG